MNWDAIATLAEVIGAVGVIASLVYLAQQIRMTRQVEHLAAFQSIVNGFTEHSTRFFSAPDELALRGLKDRSSLSEAERVLFDQMLANMISHGEMAEGAYDVGLAPEDALKELDWFLETKVFAYPGAREWLNDFSGWYAEPYLSRLRRTSSIAANRLNQGDD